MHAYHRSALASWKYSIRILLAILLLSAPAALWAQSGGTEASTAYFPRFLNGSGFDSGLAIFNPAKTDAVANLTLIDANGAGIQQASVIVPAFGRSVVTAKSLFGFSERNASLRVTSATEGLYATYTTYDEKGGLFMDGTGSAQSALSLIFPIAPGESAQSMEIFLRNATAQHTTVELKLWDLEGTALASAVIPLPGLGSYRGIAQSIFPAGTNYAHASHVTALAKSWGIFSHPQPFWGTSIFGSPAPLSGQTDLAALNGLALTEAQTAGVFPFFRTGDGDYAVVSIANVESSATDVTLNAIRNDGTSAGSRFVTLKGNGGLREAVQSLFPSLASGQQEGWILVQAAGRIAANLLYGRTETGSLSVMPLQKTPQFSLVFPQAVRNVVLNTEVSIVNPGPNAGDVRVYIVDPAGTTLAGTRLPMAAGQQVSFRLDELFPEVPELPGGLIAMLASQPVFATATVVWVPSETEAMNFPPGPVPAGYAPHPLTTFAVKGKVTLNGEPAEGFRVIISGPVGEVTTTTEDGVYEFSGLPPGKYSMKVDQYEFEFTPGVINFEITDFNIYQEFTGFTNPGEILLLPSSIPVGSSDTAVRVFGTGFNETSEAFVETVRLKTTYLSPTRLQILIPAYMAESATTFEVYVVSDGSTANPNITEPYPVVVYFDRPQLASVSTVGDIMEGSLGAVLDIGGSGFLPGAKVKINGRSDGIVVNILSDTQMIARVPASYFEIGGIYPVTVENPFPSLNAESNIQLMTVYFPTPGILGINPEFMHVQLEDSTLPQLKVYGYQFRRGAIVLMNDNPLPTVYCERTPACLAEELTANIPAEYLRRSGFARITVRNPVPSLPASELVFLRIEGLQPTITSVIPGSATVLPIPPSVKPCPPDQPDCPVELFRMIMPVVVNGTNIGPQTEVRISRCPITEPFSQEGVFIIGPTQLYVEWDVPTDPIGEWCIDIKNPEPGGGYSLPANFVITEANFVENPFLISINPAGVTAGGPSFTLILNGVNFKAGCLVNFSSGQLVPISISATEVRVEVPQNLIRVAGAKPVSVTNPDNGGTSNRIFIQVN